MPADSGSDSIVSSIIRLAHGVGPQTVAEGVETSSSWPRSTSCAVYIAQGYFWARPLTSADFTDWYRSGRITPAPPAGRDRAGEESVLPNVVIADDIETYRVLLRTVLEDQANVVGGAGDVRTAIDLARIHQPSLVLLDLSMPGDYGLDAIPRILEAARRRSRPLQCRRDGKCRRALALGALRYIEKGGSPFDVIEVCRSPQATDR